MEMAGTSDEVTDTVTWAGFGTELGAVYKPIESMVPTVEFPPWMPFTAQIRVLAVLNA